MAIMEIVLEQSYAGQQCINRFNYVASGTPATLSLSFALFQAVGALYDVLNPGNGYPSTGLMNAIADLQDSNVTFEQITVRDVYSVTDFYSSPFVNALVGDVSGDGLAPHNAFGFITNRVRTDVRRGTKRFVGVNESFSGEQGILQGSATSLCVALAAKMSAVLTVDDEGNTLTFTPAVCGKHRYEPNPGAYTPPRYAYEYWEDEATQMLHTAQGIVWDYYPNIRSQVSRQRGRGR